VKNSGEVKVFAVIVIIAAALVGGVLYYSSRPENRPGLPPPPKEMVNTLLSQPMYAYGNPKAQFTLVEFADFQCPLCRTLAPDVKKLVDQHQDKLRLVFHNVTVKPEHIHASFLGRALFAAGAQGKFWEMHQKLFDEQAFYATADQQAVENKVWEMARSLGLDVAKMQAFVNGPDGLKVQKRSVEILEKSGLRGTPSFFLIRPDQRVLAFEDFAQLRQALSQKSTWETKTE
jgi:protein-disulfide isomerase